MKRSAFEAFCQDEKYQQICLQNALQAIYRLRDVGDLAGILKGLECIYQQTFSPHVTEEMSLHMQANGGFSVTSVDNTVMYMAYDPVLLPQPTGYIYDAATVGFCQSRPLSLESYHWKQSSVITKLPVDVLCFIFAHVSPLQLLRSIPLVCKSWNKAVKRKELWMPIIMRISNAGWRIEAFFNQKTQWEILQAYAPLFYGVPCMFFKQDVIDFVVRFYQYDISVTRYFQKEEQSKELNCINTTRWSPCNDRVYDKPLVMIKVDTGGKIYPLCQVYCGHTNYIYYLSHVGFFRGFTQDIRLRLTHLLKPPICK